MKTFGWCSQDLAEICALPCEHAHICITSPQCRTIVPPCGAPFLSLQFHDLDPEAIRRTVAAKEDPAFAEELCANCMTDEHAQAIIRFVQAHDCFIVVNCEAGISRSPAVVLALRRHFGGDTESPFTRATPNAYVTVILGRALKNLK